MEKFILKRIIEVCSLFSLESMSQYGMYFTKLNLNLHDEDDEDNILTEYEKKFSEKGSRIYRMEQNFINLFNIS